MGSPLDEALDRANKPQPVPAPAATDAELAGLFVDFAERAAAAGLQTTPIYETRTSARNSVSRRGLLRHAHHEVETVTSAVEAGQGWIVRYGKRVQTRYIGDTLHGAQRVLAVFPSGQWYFALEHDGRVYISPPPNTLGWSPEATEYLGEPRSFPDPLAVRRQLLWFSGRQNERPLVLDFDRASLSDLERTVENQRHSEKLARTKVMHWVADAMAASLHGH